MNELKHIDFNAGFFEANGKEYFIESELSIDRAVWKEFYTLNLERGIEPGKQTESFSKIHDMCFEDIPNDQKIKNIAVECYNNITGFKNLFERKPIILKICGLFFNTKDEDRRFVSETLLMEKISDWIQEGYAYSTFFLFAINLLEIEVKNYKRATADILAEMESFRKDITSLADIPI